MSRGLLFLIGHLLLALGLGAAAIALVRALERPQPPLLIAPASAVMPTPADFVCTRVPRPPTIERSARPKEIA